MSYGKLSQFELQVERGLKGSLEKLQKKTEGMVALHNLYYLTIKTRKGKKVRN